MSDNEKRIWRWGVSEPSWWQVLMVSVVCPASFISAVWFIGWLTDTDPLVTEIWRLRGQISVLRERLEQLEGKATREKTLRRVLREREGGGA